MQESHLNQPNQFSGGLDLDSDVTKVGNTDYTYALNIRNGYGAVMGVIVNTKGNDLVSYTLPAGTNICLGTCEDKRGQTTLYFIYNSNGSHQILQYFPTKITVGNPYGTIEKLASGGVLNFNPDWLITHAECINGELLYWTDSYTEGQSIVGNPPRKINILKANIVGKLLEYEVYAGLPDQNQFTDPLVTVDIVVYNRTTNLVVSSYNIPSATLNLYANDPDGFLDFLANLINTEPTLSPYLKADFCTCKASVQVLSADNYADIVEANNSQKDFLFVPTNHYPFAIQQQHIDLLKYPPRCEASATYFHDTTIQYNNVQRDMFQFNVRYWFDDGEKSKWSPISLIPLNVDNQGNLIESFNAIKVDFTDTRLNDPASLCIIRKVELAFRESNNSPFKSIKVLEVCEIGINQQYLVFRNDQLFSPVPSDDVVPDGQVQALALFDSVPILSGCLESFSDAKGNSRIFLGANLENYDPLDCIEMDFTVEDAPQDDCLITIKGIVQVLTWYPTAGVPDTWALLPTTYAPPISNLDFKDRVLDGFVVYLLGTNFFAVSDNPNDGSGTGEFEIKNVPRGKYIMRVASYKCRFDNSLGAIHNLSNGLDWQKTSCPLKEVAGSGSQPGSLRTERFLDLSSFTGPIFDLSTEVGYGTIDVINLTKLVNYTGGGVASMITVEYYLLDNNAEIDSPDTNYGIRQAANAVELQRLTNNATITALIIQDYAEPNDANGYGFILYQGQGANNLTFEHFFIKNSPTGQVTLTPASYYGGYYELEQGNLTTGATRILDGGEFMMFNTDQDFTEENKTSIQGQVLDTTGSPVQNALVMLSSTNRYVITNAYGFYSILLYCPYNNVFRYSGTGRLVTTYLPDTCHDYPITDSNFPANPFTFFANIDFEHPFVGPNPTFTNGFKIGLIDFGRYLKRGGVYRTGLVYEDRGNRKNTVTETKNRLMIPFHTTIGSYSKPMVSWEINHVPPDWATHYRIVRTKETTYARYLHAPTIDVRYVKINNSLANPVDTTFAAGDATHILLGIGSNLESENITTNPVLWFYKQTEDFGFQAQLKDRVRFILDQTGAIVVTGDVWEFEIQGQYLENDTYYVVIQNTNLLKEIELGWLMELFTPKQNEEVIFYEVGECYEILFPHTDQRAHQGETQDQITIGGVSFQSAQGKIKGGDTYWRIEDFAVSADFVTNYSLEHANLSWAFDSYNSDIGRPNVVDKNFFQQFYADLIRFSGLYLPGTLINGLSSFRASDNQRIDQKIGILKRLIVAREVMLAICENKIQPIYVGKDNLLDLSGKSNIGRSDAVMNLAVQLKEDFGSRNPESVVEDEGTVYGWDVYKGIVWRYSTNGLFPISDYGARTYFSNKGKSLLNLPRLQTRAFGGFDRQYKTYLLSFATIGETLGETIAFDEPKNRWVSFFSFLPECFSKIGKNLLSFKNGGLWLHELDTVPYDNFYGVQYSSQVTFVSNAVPRAVKLWYNIDIQANKLWYCALITIPPNAPYANGMKSMLLPNKFVNTEGIWKADFLRDMNDTQAIFLNIPNQQVREATALLRGRPLRGEVLIVTLQLDDPEALALLKQADVEFVPSMDTKG